MLDLMPFLCGACGCPYNDFVICKDSSIGAITLRN